MLRKLSRRVHGGEEGLILPLLLVLLAIGGLLIAPTLGHGYTSLASTTVTEDRAQELHAADSGIEEALFWLMNGAADNAYWTWDEETDSGSRVAYSINDSSVTVTVLPLPLLGTNYYRVDSVATGPRGTTTVLSQVWAAPGAHEGLPGGDYEGDVYVDGDATLPSHDHITGDLVVTGDLTLNAQSGVDGDITVSGDFIQHAQTTVTGNICAGGDITFKAHSTLLGSVFLQLDEGEYAEIVYEGQASTGDIFVATTGSSASVEITLNNKDKCGDIYIGVGVTLTPNFHPQSTRGTIYYNWDGVTPPAPDCPGIDVGGAVITTYEIV